MSNLFNFGKSLDGSNQAANMQKLKDEAKGFKLAGTGGFLSIVKYLVFTVLACLNFHLFYTHAPGIWGVLIGSVALLFEACAIYFWNKQNQSAGAHQKALQFFAIAFTVLSFVHGTAALYQLAGVGPSITHTVELYSRYVAFPLLFGLMVLAVCVLHYVHWSTKISNARANAVLDMAKRRAELMTETARLESEALVETERLEHFKRKVILEEQYVQAVEEFAKVKARGQNVINSIVDPEVRSELMNAMGRISTQSPGAPRRIGMQPALGQDPKAPAPNQE